MSTDKYFTSPKRNLINYGSPLQKVREDTNYLNTFVSTSGSNNGSSVDYSDLHTK